jgi:hypothetical protein
MITIFGLLVVFVAIGVFARSYDRRARVIMGMAIIAVLIYMYSGRGS